jgi:outer membrane biosynthesis protein TonB
MEKKRTSELDEFKSEKARKSLLANRKYRQNIKNKLDSVNTAKDERMEEMLDILREIKKRMDDATEDTDTESDTESEDESVVVKKKKKKVEMDTDSEEEQVVKKKKTKVVDKPKKKTKAIEEEDKPKKKVVKRVVKPDVLEPDMSDDLQLQRKFPLLFNYPSFV